MVGITRSKVTFLSFAGLFTRHMSQEWAIPADHVTSLIFPKSLDLSTRAHTHTHIYIYMYIYTYTYTLQYVLVVVLGAQLSICLFIIVFGCFWATIESILL